MIEEPPPIGPTHIVYFDGSGDEQFSIFSGLCIPVPEWRACFDVLKAFRTALKQSDGVFMRKELHAWEWVSGRGRYSPERIHIARRVEIFSEALALVPQLPGATLFNASFQKSMELNAFERLLNRIERTVKMQWNGHAIIISDEGKEGIYTKMLRRMTVHNPIPSKYGAWETGAYTKNIPLERIIEDMNFRDSRRSYFIQLVDFCAYALLRREHHSPAKNELGLHQVFDEALASSCVKHAAPKDPLGVLRNTYPHIKKPPPVKPDQGGF